MNLANGRTNGAAPDTIGAAARRRKLERPVLSMERGRGWTVRAKSLVPHLATIAVAPSPQLRFRYDVATVFAADDDGDSTTSGRLHVMSFSRADSRPQLACLRWHPGAVAAARQRAANWRLLLPADHLQGLRRCHPQGPRRCRLRRMALPHPRSSRAGARAGVRPQVESCAHAAGESPLGVFGVFGAVTGSLPGARLLPRDPRRPLDPTEC